MRQRDADHEGAHRRSTQIQGAEVSTEVLAQVFSLQSEVKRRLKKAEGPPRIKAEAFVFISIDRLAGGEAVEGVH